jgi:hypothetical protein
MQASYRRDWMKQMMTGLAVFSAGTVSLEGAQHEKGQHHGGCAGDLEKRLDEIQARDLVGSAVRAARAEIESSRAYTAARRTAVLLGGTEGKEHMMRAEMHFQVRTAELRSTKSALARFVKNAAESGNSKFAEFARAGGLKDLATHTRQTCILAMTDSDVPPSEAEAAMKVLDARLAKIQSLGSFQELTVYLDHHLDELIEGKLGEYDLNGLCVLILVISSLLAVLALIAALICIFSFGLACQGVLDQMIAQACP